MLNWLFGASLLFSGAELIKEGIESCMPVEEVKPKENLAYRDEHGNVIVQNYKLFEEDEKKYGYRQASEWVATGRYNMSKVRAEKLMEEYRKKKEELMKNPFI